MASFPLDALAEFAPTYWRARAPQLAATPPDWLLRDDDEPTPKRQKLRPRTVWISDIHLGTAGCNADLLLDFLRTVQPETLYLVGDIIDGWRLKRGWYWPARHNDVLRRILKLAGKGVRVVYIPGNHDEMLRDYGGLSFGGVEVVTEAIHTTADGRRLLVLHGDEFDGVVLYARWLAFLGDHAYSLLLRLNVGFNAVRRRFRAALLVAVGAFEAPRQECRRVHLALRGGGGAGSARARRRRGRLRPHPLRRNPPVRRRHLLQRRRLGGELHRAVRASRRADGNRRLGEAHRRSAPRGFAGDQGSGARRVRITLVSDAWSPQVNGVVRTLTKTVDVLEARGDIVQCITPDRFTSVPCPTYPEIRLALTTRRRVAAMIEDFRPEAVHIATEGPLGWRARRYCIARGMPFTTSFHTRFPDYVAARTGLPVAPLWKLLSRFHGAAQNVLVATPRLAAELHGHGIVHTRPWSRGVDCAQFSPAMPPHPAMAHLPRPVQLSVGRVAVEKNIAAFLASGVPGSKVVVGDGPALAGLRAAYPEVLFLGALHGAELASAYAAADVFVFPSRTDTFGLVMIEALASGVPVAGYPVAGPLDVVGEDGRGVVPAWDAAVGACDADLDRAIARALLARRDDCAAYARHFSWDRCADQFIAGLAEFDELPLAA